MARPAIRYSLFSIAILWTATLASPLAATEILLDLADIVGGGDGTGTGSAQGIDQTNGNVVFAQVPGNHPDGSAGVAARYHSVAANPFIDGVFVPRDTTMQINSLGTTVGYPARTGNSWGYIYSGANNSIDPPVLSGTNYSTNGNSLISMHANKGITFDLDAIRAANPGLDITRISAVTGDVSASGGNTDYNIYVDGTLRYGRGGNVGTTAYGTDVSISSGNRFVTFVATSGGDDYSFDQTIFGNPTVHLSDVANVARGATVVNRSGDFQPAWSAERAVDGQFSDVHEFSDGIGPAKYWLGGLNNGSDSFTLDLGSQKDIQTIRLTNTHNDNFRDRGTRDFEIYASNSVDGGGNLVNPTKILESELTTSYATMLGDVQLPSDTFTTDNGLESGSYRYVQFVAKTGTFNNNLVGLNEIEIFESKLAANVAAGATVTGPAYSAEFSGANLVDQRMDDLRNLGGDVYDGDPSGNASYWLGRDGVAGETLDIDLGDTFTISELQLQNTHNGQFNDRGTEDFVIYASEDGVTFEEVLSGTLASGAGLGGDVPIEAFSAAAGDFTEFSAQFLRFEATSFYGAGAGLSELRAFGASVVPEPASLAVWLGLGSLLWLARRRK